MVEFAHAKDELSRIRNNVENKYHESEFGLGTDTRNIFECGHKQSKVPSRLGRRISIRIWSQAIESAITARSTDFYSNMVTSNRKCYHGSVDGFLFECGHKQSKVPSRLGRRISFKRTQL